MRRKVDSYKTRNTEKIAEISQEIQIQYLKYTGPYWGPFSGSMLEKEIISACLEL